jgi:hypothetical protein
LKNPFYGVIRLELNYKYEIDTKVTAKRELTIQGTDENTGGEYEIIIPEGSNGIIEASGRNSRYGFKAHYDVLFTVNGEELPEVTFFEDDLENELEFHRDEAII